MGKLLNKLKTNNTVLIEDSNLFRDVDFCSTNIPIVDIALSGEIGKGLSRGLTVFAGPSRHFKSLVALLTVKSYMDAYPDSVCVFYDSEYGTTPTYFKSVGIDTSRVLHNSIENLEKFRGDVTKLLEKVEVGEKVIIFVDSFGNIPSKKEIDDALDDNESADMTRAKVMKSVTRIVMSYLNTRNVPMVAVGHTYDTMETYSKKVVSGGTGIMYNANNVIIMGRRKVKKDKEVLGHDFILNIDKSRFVKEGSKLPLRVSFEEGIAPYTGLIELAVATGLVTKHASGWYTRDCVEGDKKWREAEAEDSKEFWIPIFEETDFKERIKTNFQPKDLMILKEDNNDEEDSKETDKKDNTKGKKGG